MARLPPDACPFERPFPDDFDGCPAFQRSEFRALDTDHRPLRTVNSCRHLEVGSLPGHAAGFYARCGLGDLQARRRWVVQVEQKRLDAIRAISRALGDQTRDVTRALWEAKAEQLQVRRSGEPSAAHTRRLRQLGREYQRRLDEFFAARADELAAAQLPAEAVRDLIGAVLEDWIRRPSLGGGCRVPDAMLERFPEEVRVFLRPDSGQATGTTSDSRSRG